VKHLITIILFLLFSISLSFGNGGPIYAILNEFYIDSLGQWTIELKFSRPENIDSIIVESTSRISRVADFPGITTEYIGIIDNSNMENPLSFDPEGDIVTVISYNIAGVGWTTYLYYGDVDLSYVQCAEEGDSYAKMAPMPYLGWGWAICNEPSLGLPNEYNGVLATTSGMVLDQFGEPLDEGWFEFDYPDMIIEIQPDGSFNKLLYARNYFCEEITVHNDTVITYPIETIDFCTRPDTTFEFNFIATIPVSLAETAKEKEPVIFVSPNPFHSDVTFYWNPDDFPSQKRLEFIIFNAGGIELFRTAVPKSSKQFIWEPESDLNSGIYIYHVVCESQRLTGGKVIKF
jgi:hypothetical protein